MSEHPKPHGPAASTAAPASVADHPRRHAAKAHVAIDLALQGGGSHGAFTWGVLDALLDEERLDFSGISGTSAGALNAAVLATGMARGGREGARQALRALWSDIGSAGAVFGSDPTDAAGPFKLENHPAYEWISAVMRTLSPYQFNPLGINPLREVVRRHVDVDALREGPIALYITATAVTTGRPRIFSGAEVSIDALMASACLPQLFQAVEIDGVPYWDGGYAGNPSLWPLIYDTPAVDLLLVRINPLSRPGTPTTAMEILDRVNEITFNAALIGEMRAIAFVKRLIADQKLDPGRYKDLRVHMIGDDAALEPFGAASKISTDPRLLAHLFDLGRGAAMAWLERHRGDLGKRSTVDIEASFLGPSARGALPR